MTATIPDENDLRHWLVDYLVTTIGCNPDEVDLDLSLSDVGVGSRDAVVLSGELSELLGRPVSPVEFWQHSTVNALAAYLAAPESESAQSAISDRPDRGAVDEPIAVIGIGCRFPGGIAGPDALWDFLCEGRSAISEVPPDRWLPFDDGSPEVAAALAGTTRWGSFLADIDAFDAEFFEISPREAARMDPQQRLLLEVAWEALEHSGIPASALRRSATGVFAGACANDYGFLALRDLDRVDAWSNTGAAVSILANRLSYFLDLRGPSLAVDTACSSSLVAVHLACQNLRLKECDLALAAGVNLLLSPAIFRSFDQAQALSPTGQCHAFDAAADGFVRGEGCGVVVLKRLTDAVRDGDRVLAVVRGSAVNQDGRSNGLMAPNPAAQMAVLRAAYANAGIPPFDVDYVEAHGTGTLLGDPIEARALGAVLGRGRAENSPLLIGAVKTNLGHLEAAAGIVGFIKTVLAVQRRHIPPNLGFQTPNPHIAFDEVRLKVVAEQQDWPSVGRARRAGVSSFGFGGTNAHVVVEQAPDPVMSVGPVGSVCTLVVSGKSVGRVGSWAGRLADWMDGDGAAVALGDVAHTLNHHRGRHAVFGTVCARDRSAAVAGLRALAAGQSGPGVVAPHEGVCGSGRVFVFSGQGSQWVGMGRRLLADEPAFAAAVKELDPVFVEQVGFSLQQVLAGGLAVSGIERIQPVLVGMQLALTALWRAYGVEPDAVVGHSMGEVVAAVVAGALSAADGLRVIVTRSRLMARLSGRGAMALLELDAAAAEAAVADFADVGVAVYASPRQTVIAGPPDQVDAVMAVVAGQDRLARRVDVDVASHHRIIDPILPQLRGALADLAPKVPVIPMFSTTYDHLSGAPTFHAGYWVDNLRRPVRFSDAITAAAENHSTFIEISPHPLLTHAISETVGAAHHHAIATLQRDTDDTVTFHTNLNSAHTTHPPHTDHPPEPHPALPTTPWHHTHHWITTTTTTPTSGSAPKAGTLLGQRITVSSTRPAHLWQARLVPEAKPYPGHHRLHGVEVVPASVLLQTLLAAAVELGTQALSDVRFQHPVVVDRPKVIQVVADDESVSVASGSTADTPVDRWTTHVTARLSPFISDAPAFCSPESNSQPRNQTVNAGAGSISELLFARGVEGRPFPWSLGSCTTTSGGLLAHVDLTEESPVALLDAALHVAPMAGTTDSRLYVPAGVEHVQLGGALTQRYGSVSVRHIGGRADEVIVDVAVGGRDGEPGISLSGLRYSALDAGGAPANASDADPRSFAHTIEWRPRQHQGDARAATDGSATVAVIGDEARVAADLRKRLAEAGYAPAELTKARYVLYSPGTEPTDDAEADIDQAVRMSATVTSLVRGLAERSEQEPVTLWILTTGVHEAENRAAVWQSCLWGLAGVIAAEHPEIWGGLVDVASAYDIGETAKALAKVLATPGNTVLVLRNDVFHTPELVPATGEPVRDALRCKADASYLITGGLGALGLLAAGWLADRGARRLLLAGRTSLPARRDWDGNVDIQARQRIIAIRELERRGVSVEVVTLDIGSIDDVHALLARRDRDGAPPIRGVIHAAGVTDDQLVASTTQDSIRQVMWPKISGGQALHESFPCGSLDFFFLMSSAASVFGIPGQGSYAAANAYLDALARARNRRGCHTLSLDWAAWHGLGFASNAQIVVQELQRLGSRALTPDEAFTAWEHVYRRDVAQSVVLPVPSSAGHDLLSDDLLSGATAHAWSQMSAADVESELRTTIWAIIVRELRTADSELEVDRPFVELGLNSMMALSIRREIEQLVGLELSATMLWNYPTIALLAAHLAKKLAPQEERLVDDVEVLSDSTASVLDTLFDRVESSPASTETRI